MNEHALTEDDLAWKRRTVHRTTAIGRTPATTYVRELPVPMATLDEVAACYWNCTPNTARQWLRDLHLEHHRLYVRQPGERRGRYRIVMPMTTVRELILRKDRLRRSLPA